MKISSQAEWAIGSSMAVIGTLSLAVSMALLLQGMGKINSTAMATLQNYISGSTNAKIMLSGFCFVAPILFFGGLALLGFKIHKMCNERFYSPADEKNINGNVGDSTTYYGHWIAGGKL